jgi:uncharacterized protein YcbK (DUF882 family)
MRFVVLVAPLCLALAGCISDETAGIDASVPQSSAPLVATFVPPAEAPLPVARPDFGDRVAAAPVADTQATSQTATIGNPSPDPEPVALAFAPSARTLVAYEALETAEEDEEVDQPLDPQPAAEGQRWRLAYSYVKADCFPEELKRALNQISEHFKSDVLVVSGYRGNGRRGSLHRSCRAADIRVVGVAPTVLAAYARTVPGINGVGTYRRNSLTHIDVRETKFAWRY